MAQRVKSVTVIYSPYHVGAYNQRVSAGPFCLRHHGVIEAIQLLGTQVNTKDIPPVDEFEGEIGKSFEILCRTATGLNSSKRLVMLQLFQLCSLAIACPLLMLMQCLEM